MSQRNEGNKRDEFFSVGKEKYARALFVFAFAMGIMILQAPKSQASNTNDTPEDIAACVGGGIDRKPTDTFVYIPVTEQYKGELSIGMLLPQTIGATEDVTGPGKVVSVYIDREPPASDTYCVQIPIRPSSEKLKSIGITEEEQKSIDQYRCPSRFECVAGMSNQIGKKIADGRIIVGWCKVISQNQYGSTGQEGNCVAYGTGSSRPPVPATPSLKLFVDPINIQVGQSARLTSVPKNVSSCWGWQVVDGAKSGGKWFDPKGESMDVSPTRKTEYFMECWNSASPAVSTSVQSVTVTVGKTASLFVSADETELIAGSTATLRWTTKNAKSCMSWINNEVAQPMTADDGDHFYVTKPLAVGKYVYSAACSNDAGDSTGPRSVTITVRDAKGTAGKPVAPVVPIVCSDPHWTPDPASKCPSDTVTQTDGCGNTRQVAGTNPNCGSVVSKRLMICPRHPKIRVGEQVQFTAYWGTNATRYPDNITCADPEAYNYQPSNTSGYSSTRWAWDEHSMQYHTITNNGLATGIAPGTEDVDVWEQWNGQRVDDNGVRITVLPKDAPIDSLPENTEQPASNTSRKVKLSWNSRYTAKCHLSGGGMNEEKDTEGFVIVSPLTDTVYTMECWSAAGKSTGKKVLTVKARE